MSDRIRAEAGARDLYTSAAAWHEARAEIRRLRGEVLELQEKLDQAQGRAVWVGRILREECER